ncbi:MAG: selenocysteine-specific translation elongation factor [Defluviitaleaceae bacterium]|nr:selenocysteine-specific translation elongation factor [Defluviitaleaceae bacterium]
MNSIIGTAGHVDHGKTALIRALTGIETDRLKEEQKRGITIELGFAYLTLPNNEKIGIIDVPGHEKFIKNMLAGAGSMDLVILVVAADEGFMPQTREHLSILSLLGTKQGVIALTKTDIVEQEWLEMVIMDVEEEVAGSFLENSPIIPVSSHTGQGLNELRYYILELLNTSPKKPDFTPFRLPIDRVFSMDGFGTIVTGTLIEGQLRLGDNAIIHPSLKTGKIRRLQVHGSQVEVATPSSRVAVNIAGIHASEVARGDVLSAVDSMENSNIIHTVINILPDSNREIINNSRLHLHHGAREMLCRLNLIGQPSLNPGETGFAQLICEEEIAAKPQDPFILRFYSPLETIGGGIILNPIAKKIPRKAQNITQSLDILHKGNVEERIAEFIKIFSEKLAKISWFYNILFGNIPESEFQEIIEQLVVEKTLYKLGNRIVHIDYLNKIGKNVQNILSLYHEKNPFQKGMPRNEVKSRLFGDNSTEDKTTTDSIIEILVELGFIYDAGNHANSIAHCDFSVKINEAQEKVFNEILAQYENYGATPPTAEQVATSFKDPKLFWQGLNIFVENGDIIALDGEIFMHTSQIKRSKEIFANIANKNSNGTVELAEFRDAMDISRKYALAILEYFDKKNITKKSGNTRLLVI